MLRSNSTLTRLLVLLALALDLGSAATAQTPDPVALLQDMQRALVPTRAQLSRVTISAHSDQPGGGDKSWDALVIRERDEKGPRTAFSIIAPPELNGAGVLVATLSSAPTLRLWLYAPDQQRAIEFSPLEADRQFLATRFNFEDVALAIRDTQPPQLLGSEGAGQHLLWKIETRPALDRYYSRILTWIADDTRLPLKREYYDRGGHLWKVVNYRVEIIDDIPTVMAIELHDVQSRDTCAWRVTALRYLSDELPKRVLSPAGLADLSKLEVWHTVGKEQRATSDAEPAR